MGQYIPSYAQYTGPFVDFGFMLRPYFDFCILHAPGSDNMRNFNMLLAMLVFACLTQDIVLGNATEYNDSIFWTAPKWICDDDGTTTTFDKVFGKESTMLRVYLLPTWTMIVRRIWILVTLSGSVLLYKHK